MQYGLDAPTGHDNLIYSEDIEALIDEYMFYGEEAIDEIFTAGGYGNPFSGASGGPPLAKPAIPSMAPLTTSTTASGAASLPGMAKPAMPMATRPPLTGTPPTAGGMGGITTPGRY